MVAMDNDAGKCPEEHKLLFRVWDPEQAEHF